MNAGDPMISVDGLVRAFGALTAVDGIAFEVARGEMFGLIGPDGAGKTTTLRTILGLLRPDAGTLRVAGADPWREQRRIAERVGYLSQRFSLYGDLSVDENIEFFAEVHGVRKWRPRRDELLDLLRMTPFRDRMAERLSGGMKQKLALACTLVHTPELLVLDEPTTGVDPVSRRDFWKILVGLQREGLTILLTTPYLDEAERCQRIALLDHGRVLLAGAPDALRRDSKLHVIELLAEPKADAAAITRTVPGVEAVQVFGERLHLTLAAGTDPAHAVDELAAALAHRGVHASVIRPVEPLLEDIFIAEIRAATAAAREADA